MTLHLHHADCLEWLGALAGRITAGEAEAFDSCVTDPPYHLTSIVRRFGKEGSAPARAGKAANHTRAYARASKGFMGKEWDGGDVAFRPETWRAVFDCLKPGAHLIAFSGTRTYHRMVCAIEDAGFEVRDQLAWVYGSGFPKSHDVSKAIDRHNGDARAKVRVAAVDLANPPNLVGGAVRGDDRPWRQKALETGFHEVDGPTAAWQGWGTALKPAFEPVCLARKPLSEKSVAANVLKHGTGAIHIDACRVGSTGATSKATSKSDTSSVGNWLNAKPGDPIDAGRWPTNLCHDGSDEVLAGFPETSSGQVSTHHKCRGGSKIGTFKIRDRTGEERNWPGDSGSAARFFYSAKAGPLDRIGTAHATVKPVDLMRWLVRMVTPPGGHVLEPFAGSGTTGIACMAEGFDCTMIELEKDHVADIARKLAVLRGEGRLKFIEHDRQREERDVAEMDLGLFAGIGADR